MNVNSVNETYQKALKAGDKSKREPSDEFYGNRGDCISNFTGNHWFIATHKKDLSRDELKRLAEEQFKNWNQKIKIRFFFCLSLTKYQMQ